MGLVYCGLIRNAVLGLGAIILLSLINPFFSAPFIKISIIISQILIHIGLLVWAVIAAYKSDPEYQLKKYNRMIFYILLFMFYFSFSDLEDSYLTNNATMHTSAMQQTLNKGDLVVINVLAYALSSPQANDVVIYFPDSNAIYPLVGRIVATPGQQFSIEQGELFVDNKSEKMLFASDKAALVSENIPAMTSITSQQLSENEYFILGDNHDAAYDCRFLGNINGNLIRGRIDAVIYSTIEKKPLLSFDP